MCLCILDSFHSPSLLQFNLGRQIDHAALMKKSNISKHTHIVGVVICTCRQGSCGSTCSLYALGSYVHPFEALQVSTYHLRGPSILPRVLPCELQSCSRAPIRPGGLENRNEASARRREPESFCRPGGRSRRKFAVSFWAWFCSATPPWSRENPPTNESRIVGPAEDNKAR